MTTELLFGLWDASSRKVLKTQLPRFIETLLSEPEGLWASSAERPAWSVHILPHRRKYKHVVSNLRIGGEWEYDRSLRKHTFPPERTRMEYYAGQPTRVLPGKGAGRLSR